MFGIYSDIVLDAAFMSMWAYGDTGLPPSINWQILGSDELSPLVDPLNYFEDGPYFTEKEDNGFDDAKALVALKVTNGVSTLYVSFRGTDYDGPLGAPTDILDYYSAAVGTYINAFNPLLEMVKSYAITNSIPPENIVFTGHSLGAAAANNLRDSSLDASIGDLHWFFSTSKYVTFATPFNASSTEILNVGFENDPVFRNGFETTARTNDFLLFNDEFANLDFPGMSFGLSSSWGPHDKFGYIDAIQSIDTSPFRNEIGKNSVVIIADTSEEVIDRDAISIDQTIVTNHADQGAYIIGNAAINTLTGNSGDDAIYGAEGNDFISGGLGFDRLWGGDGDDIILPGGGHDQIDGGAGNDDIYASGGNDTINGGSGTDVVIFSSNADDYAFTLQGDGSVTVAALATDEGFNILTDIEILRFADGDEVIDYDLNYPTDDNGNYILNGTEFADYLRIDYDPNQNRSALIYGLGGNDIIHGAHSAGGQYIIQENEFYGGDGRDQLFGHQGEDELYGGNGNDILDGGRQNDLSIRNGGWTDILSGGDGRDEIRSYEGADIIDGGEGIDTLVYYRRYLPDGVPGTTIMLEDERDVVFTYNPDGISTFVNSGTTVVNIENFNIQTNSGDDIITTGEGNDILRVAGGDNVINSGGGNDSIYIGHGNNYVDAGAGNDSISHYRGVPEGVDPGPVGNNQLIGGNGDDHISSGAGDDILDGGFGNDQLSGGSGNDVLIGGPGDDLISGAHYSDEGQVTNNIAVYAGNRDDFQIWHRGDFYDVTDTVGDQGEDRLSGIDIIRFDDGDYVLPNTISDHPGGTSADNFFRGLDYWYDEKVTRDRFFAGDGNDILVGYAGDDLLYGEGGDDFLVGGIGADILDGGDGNDTISYSLSIQGVTINLYLSLASGGEAQGDTLISIENASGSNFDDTLIGDDLVNALAGSDGNDLIEGAGGNDQINGGIGYDTAIFSGDMSDYEVIQTSLAGYRVTHLNGGTDGVDTLESIEALQFADQTLHLGILIFGTPGNDQIEGTLGPDNIQTSSGDDQVTAGSGDDIIVGDIAGQGQIDGGAGSDLFRVSGEVSVDYSELNGEFYIHITTNAGVYDLVSIERFEVFTSDNSAYLIDGQIGTDAPDVINLNYYTVPAFVFGLLGDDEITGGYADDILYGLDGNDTLAGGDGWDTLLGGTGDDIINGGDGIDTVVFSGLRSEYEITEIGSQRYQVSHLNDGIEGTDIISFAEVLQFSDESITLELDNTNEPILGTNGDDTIIGTNNNDIINGFGGTDTIHSNNGDDIIIGDAQGQGTIDGGQGNDVFRINSPMLISVNPHGQIPILYVFSQIGSYAVSNVERVEFYNGSFLNLEGLAFLGTSGDDIIDHSTETIDLRILGGDGNDEITGGSGTNELRGFNGDDTITGGDGSEILDGGNGQDVLEGNGGFNRIFGGSDNDILNGGDDGNWLIGGSGTDSLNGGSGYDVIWYSDSSEGVTINLTTGAAIGGTAEGDSFSLVEGIVGSQFSDTLVGDDGNNNISARGGDDIVFGGSGDDTISGEEGNDTIDAGNGDDQIYGNLGNDTLSGGSGADQFSFNQLAGAFTSTITDFESGDTLAIYDDFTVVGDNLPTFIDTAEFTNTSWEIRYDRHDGQTIVQLDINGDGLSDETLTLANGEFVLNFTRGYRLDIFIKPSIDGTLFDDALMGTSSDDTLKGYSGNDHITGGSGADIIDGGAGNDTASYNDAASGVVASLRSGITATGDAAGDTLTSIENLEGSAFNDTLWGDNTANTITGGYGNDFLRGQGGDDVLDGGFGVDYLRGGAGADVLRGYAGQDWADYITSSAAVTVNLLTNTATGGDAEGDTFFLVERVYGSSHDDHITGDNGVNYLRGWSGDDQLFGGAGNDYLQGGLGADTLDGGAGSNDWAYYVSSTIGLTLNLGDSSLNTGEAIGDTYINVENIVGSRHDDDITGDSGNNFLRGLQGDDSLHGGDGNDFLRGEQGADVHDGGAGADWAYYATNSTAVTIDLGANTASGGDATGDSFISIERVYGSRYDDSITGDSGVNYLRGYFGNDTLNGGDGIDFLQGDAGADTLNGGDGSDWAYYASSQNGLVVNLGDASQNTGEASGDSYISIENVFGTKFNDIITGDSGDNYLRGFSGDDIINGGAGNDTLRGEAGADTFVFEAGTGSDTVIDYNDAEDMLDLTNFGFANVSDALSNAVDINGDVVFTIGADIITIEETTINEITDNLIV